jgi:hypothetical protein
MAKHSSAAAAKMAKMRRTAAVFVNRQPIGLKVVPASLHVGPEERYLSMGTVTGIPEEIEWVSMDGTGYTVTFDKGDGSPFADDCFEVPSGGSVSSGPITGPIGAYGYTARDRSGRHVKDPAIIVTE